MTKLVDWQIKLKCSGDKPMISPFIDHQEKFMGVSHGLSSVGYDIRLGGNPNESFIINPQHSILAVSVERFIMPKNVAGICVGKSTWARKFLLVNLTLLEPEWEGYLTLELSNLGRSDIILNAGQGIAQIIFEEIKTPEITYADRNGKYQNQPNRPVAAIESV